MSTKTGQLQLAFGNILFGGGRWGKDWSVRGLQVKRRERITKVICGHFRQEAQVREAGGWEQVVKPLWEDILAEKLADRRATRREQTALLHCFEHLSGNEQTEFAKRFVEGPGVSPDYAFKDEVNEARDGIQNRSAAVEVLEHCLKGDVDKEQRHWKWYRVRQILKTWWEEEKHSHLRPRLADLMAKLGMNYE